MSPDMIKTAIVLIVKHKCGNISESSNYRPVTIITIISKVFESVLLLKCEDIFIHRFKSIWLQEGLQY